MSIKDKLRAAAAQAALNGAAVVAMITLIMATHRTLGYALAVACLAAAGWQALALNVESTLPAQVMLAGGILAGYSHQITDASRVPVVVAGTLVVALAAAQPTLRAVVNRPTNRVAHLPGYRPGRDLVVAPRVLYASTLPLIGVFAASGYLDAPVWPVIVLAAALLGGVAVVGGQALRLRLRGSVAQREFRAAVEAYDPRFALYFSAPDNTEYHVTMWLPYLERIGEPFVVILREPQSFAVIAAATSAPVVYCPGIAFVDQIVTDRMTACFYVNNGAKNSHMVRFNRLTHIQLLHGDSDKASSFNPVTAMFDRIFVAGQAGIDRYAANGVLIPAEKFDIVGRPQVESVRVARGHISAVPRPTVLYATTWVGNYTDANYCSLPIGETIVARLLERGVRVILRPHPYADRHAPSARQLTRLEQMLADDRAKSGRPHVFGAAVARMSVTDSINAADALISDVSSVASDWLFSAKPFALTNMVGADPQAYARICPLADRAAYVLDSAAAAIDAVLDDLLGADPLAAARREVRAYYLGDLPEDGYADRFVGTARGYLDTTHPPSPGELTGASVVVAQGAGAVG